jgi:hypothetical protein
LATGFFHEASSPKPLKIALGTFQIIFENSRKWCTNSINDTNGKFATGFNDTGGKFASGTAGVVDTCGKFAAGVIDTGGKFAAGINGTDDNVTSGK